MNPKSKKPMPRPIVIKLLKTKGKEKQLKESERNDALPTGENQF